ncbi:GFA family protein [Sphingomonas sp. PAMC26645]|uniref:GFA family protein n=1 Tax=Sphingomonas sp. PAMC26645 TaxID=2565555 RepID=UPI00109DF4C0|nr:GFA family protein [Sphingomonas sp. PAMC26645]QCB42412.1 GFA family protein [Sphingomonas sp. PAMC26645]
MLAGRCHCGAISYVAEGEPEHHALCHCGDCRRSAGAPMVGWIAFRSEQVTIAGDPVTYESSASGRRQFCGRCGTGLFYTNAEYLPGIIDVQSCTLDDPEAVAPGAHIQVADRLAWMANVAALPAFERYPGM